CLFSNENATAAAWTYQARRRQHLDRVAHDRATDAEVFSEFLFGRQTIASAQLMLADVFDNQLGNAFVLRPIGWYVWFFNEGNGLHLQHVYLVCTSLIFIANKYNSFAAQSPGIGRHCTMLISVFQPLPCYLVCAHCQERTRIAASLATWHNS